MKFITQQQSAAGGADVGQRCRMDRKQWQCNQTIY